MITPYHSYSYGYIFLVIKDLAGLPAKVEVDGKILFRKDEFHVSLMAPKYLVPLINSDANNNITEYDLAQDFLEYQLSNSLSTFQSTNTFRYVKRNERETIIVMVNVPNIEGLFNKLRVKYGANIPTQPTHITLYELNTEKSIGILSQNELKRDSKQIELPELKIN